MRRRIQIAVLAISCWLIADSLIAQVNSDSLILVYKAKMRQYLDKDGRAGEVFSFTKDGIEVYAPATDTSERKMVSQFNWPLIPPVKITTQHVDRILGRDKMLEGFKIALDPGHIAGDLETAKMEKKWVEMKKPPVQLIEGQLTLATALILKKKLEEQGATVMLTRDKPNISAFGISFKKWKDSLFVKSAEAAYLRGDLSFEERNYLLHKANDTEIFRRFFSIEDVRERARKINEFNPDLTLIIHYNVDETNQNWNKPTKKNFNMAFVGGSFTAEELEKPEARANFLRLLLTDDIQSSINFSKYIVESLVSKTGVPSALDSCALYLKGNCLSTNVNGVFCRNLTLTRTVKGTLCYGESLYQDNVNECKQLGKKDASTPLSVTNGIETSKRVEEVAEAYYQGIMNYMKNWNR